MKCPCGLSDDYTSCCERFHTGDALPETAEQLMRSRYAAFVTEDTAYLKDTYWPAYQSSFDADSYAKRAQASLWLGLEVLATEKGNRNDTSGTVTFIASAMINASINKHREKSLFRKKGGRWYYVEALS